MRTLQAEPWFPSQCQLAEGPTWVDPFLYWVDIPGQNIHRAKLDRSEHKVWKMPDRPGSLAPIDNERFIVALADGPVIWNSVTEELAFLAKIEPNVPEILMNEGKTDPRGRFFCGTRGRVNDEPCGALYVADHDGSVRKLFGPVTNSNGLAWTEDEKTLYYNDTRPNHIYAFDYDAETGNISNQRLAIEMPEELGKPDGMCIDREGNLWIGHWQGSMVGCWNPRTAELLVQVEIPVRAVTSCCFAGPEFDELYITTGKNWTPPEVLATTPHAGDIFVVRPGVSGYPTLPYAYTGSVLS